MILRAENILGGTLITLHWEQAADRVSSAAILNANECRSFAAAIIARQPFERKNDFAMLWPPNPVWPSNLASALILVGTDEVKIPSVNMGDLQHHITDRSSNAIWQFGAAQI
jgi:hypothetical protein